MTSQKTRYDIFDSPHRPQRDVFFKVQAIAGYSYARLRRLLFPQHS